MIDTERTQPIDAVVVAFDETQYYVFKGDEAEYIEKILGVYLIDLNEITHCCELTPSYYLRHIYDTMVLTEAGEALDDFEKERLSQEYEFCESNDKYVHCGSIDKMVRSGESVYSYGATDVSYEDSSYEDQIEGLMEHFRGNCPF